MYLELAYQNYFVYKFLWAPTIYLERPKVELIVTSIVSGAVKLSTWWTVSVINWWRSSVCHQCITLTVYICVQRTVGVRQRVARVGQRQRRLVPRCILHRACTNSVTDNRTAFTDYYPDQFFWATRFSRSHSLYAVAHPSVKFMCSTRPVEIFGNVSTPFGTLAIRWHPLKISRRSSQGTLRRVGG